MSNITQKWVNLLMPFTSNYGSKLSGTELAKMSRIPQQTASRYLKEMVKQNILEYEMQGRSKLFYFDYSKLSTKAILEILENSKAMFFQQKVKDIVPIINDMLKQAESMVVFGSYSSHTFDKSSDLDIVLMGKCNKNEIKKIKQKQIVQINEHYISYAEFSRLLKSKNPLAFEILKNHILFGNISKLVDVFIEATS